MKRSDLFREYARVIDMCEESGVYAYRCVKYCGHEWDSPTLNGKIDAYTFAIGICEGKPVFAGDTLYDSSGNDWTVRYARDNFNEYSWAKPDPYAELKKAQADGKVIQVNHITQGWLDCKYPNWSSEVDMYRIKPEPVIKQSRVKLFCPNTTHHAFVNCTWTDGVLSVEIEK